jgi:amidohydrolase
MRNLSDYLNLQHDSIITTYKALHEIAEPSWHEEKTAAYIQEMLMKAGIKTKTFKGHCGFIAEIPGKTAEVIALRTDMDALMQEVDGTVRPNHSCGHDAHSTMVLFSALALAQSNLSFQHTIRFIFQPAEELATGALQMINDGVLENVKFLGGIHLRPKMELPMSKVSPVILHGSNASITGVIKGVQAHAARPQEGRNPIEAAALLINVIQSIRLKVKGNFSIKMTELYSGVSSNAIPETARFNFDLRAESNEVMDNLIEKAFKMIEKVAALTETTIDAKLEDLVPAATKNAHAMEIAENAIVTVMGLDGFEATCVSPGAEDFHFYSLKNPEISSTMIGLGCDLTPGLHHPKMTFNLEALLDGTKILTQMILNADSYEW